jgi:hypothetical protein
MSQIRTLGNVGRNSGFGEDALVVVFVGGDDVVGAEVFLGVDVGGLAICSRGRRGTSQNLQALNRRGHSGRMTAEEKGEDPTSKTETVAPGGIGQIFKCRR